MDKLPLPSRQVAQIIRRKMTTKVKPSGKVYSRSNNKKTIKDSL